MNNGLTLDAINEYNAPVNHQRLHNIKTGIHELVEKGLLTDSSSAAKSKRKHSKMLKNNLDIEDKKPHETKKQKIAPDDIDQQLDEKLAEMAERIDKQDAKIEKMKKKLKSKTDFLKKLFNYHLDRADFKYAPNKSKGFEGGAKELGQDLEGVSDDQLNSSLLGEDSQSQNSE